MRARAEAYWESRVAFASRLCFAFSRDSVRREIRLSRFCSWSITLAVFLSFYIPDIW